MIFIVNQYVKLNNPMRYHVGIGCSFGASKHNVHKTLADNLGATFVNLSAPGQGNFRIYTELLYWIATNPEKLGYTSFSIGWSGIYRNDVIEKNHHEKLAFKWDRWRADRDDPTLKNLPKNIDIELDHSVRFLTYVLGTQNQLQISKVKYVMYNAIDTYLDRSTFNQESALRIKILEKQIDKKFYFKFTESQSRFIADHKYFLDATPASVVKTIINWPTDDVQYPVKDAHPSAEGDNKWADMVWNFCKNNQIL